MNALRIRWQALRGGLQHWYGRHSRRDQRIIVGVLVLVAVCVAYLWGWLPLRDYRQTVAEEIADGQEQLARAARILGSADSLRAERESLEKRLKQSRERLLPGRGGTLGAAALQERTNSLAAEKGITVQSTQVMKEEALDPYRKVSVRLTLSGELQPFAELVSGLEYGQQLAIPIVEINRRGAVAGAKGPRTLSATVEVTGFVLSEDAKAEDAAAEGGEALEAAPAEGGEAAKPAATATAPAAATGVPTGAATGASEAVGASGPGVAAAPTTSTTSAPAGASVTTTTRGARAVTTTTRGARAVTTTTRGAGAGATATTVRAGSTATTTTLPAALRQFLPNLPPAPAGEGQETR